MISNNVNRTLCNGAPCKDTGYHESLGNYYSLVMTAAEVDSLGLHFGDGSGNDTPFTIMAWVNSHGGVYTIFSVDREYTFLNTAKILLYEKDSSNYWIIGREVSTQGWITGNTNKWTHWAATYDGGKSASGLKIYIDGNKVDDADDNTGSYGGMGDEGRSGYTTEVSGGSGKTGLMSDISIYGVELTADDIRMIASHRHGFNHMLWNKGSDCKFWTDMSEQYRGGAESQAGWGLPISIKDNVSGDKILNTNAAFTKTALMKWNEFKIPTTK